MLTWGNGKSTTVSAEKFDPLAVFDDTVSSLINIYLKDPDSPFQPLRFHTKTTYEARFKKIRASAGSKRISTLKFRDFKRLYEGWREPKVEGDPERVSHAYEHIKFTRIVFAFGALLELPRCIETSAILSGMEFENPKRRTEVINRAQAEAICRQANAVGSGSIALAQALQHDLMIRQKDAIGELIPMSEPGISDQHQRGFKWGAGLRWEEIDAGMKLKHRVSKSVRGRGNLANPDAGKIKTWNLPLYPMVMQQLALMAGVTVGELRRDMLPASGPVVIAEHSGFPWRQKFFAERWRKIAHAAGVPDHVQNRDSRAGGATEAEQSGVDLEMIRKGLGHSKPDTSRIYLRDEEVAEATIVAARFGKKT